MAVNVIESTCNESVLSNVDRLRARKFSVTAGSNERQEKDQSHSQRGHQPRRLNSIKTLKRMQPVPASFRFPESKPDAARLRPLKTTKWRHRARSRHQHPQEGQNQHPAYKAGLAPQNTTRRKET